LKNPADRDTFLPNLFYSAFGQLPLNRSSEAVNALVLPQHIHLSECIPELPPAKILWQEQFWLYHPLPKNERWTIFLFW
jgi:hypothetical protein